MKQAVILFTRVPRPGVTKTRLLPVLKGEQCALLHRAFLQDLSRVYAGLEAELFVAYTPDPDWEMLKEIFPHAVDFFPQQGADLGEKMYHAIDMVLKQGFDGVVLTGADLPLMEKSHLRSGFAALEKADIAIGATDDGGYYLIGMKRPEMCVFRVEGYGGATVFENTVKAACDAGLQVGFAATCSDVDTPEDLRCLMQAVSPESHTGNYLQKLKEEGVIL